MLPTRLAKYDGLLDLLVDALLREIEQEGKTATPATSCEGAGVNFSTAQDFRQHGDHIPAGSISAS